MDKKFSQLEYTILELGAEVYRLKHEMSTLNQHNEQLNQTFSRLRDVLNDKGYIDGEEFDLVGRNLRISDLLNETSEPDSDGQKNPSKNQLH
jgi:regulator of replication initiation timing